MPPLWGRKPLLGLTRNAPVKEKRFWEENLFRTLGDPTLGWIGGRTIKLRRGRHLSRGGEIDVNGIPLFWAEEAVEEPAMVGGKIKRADGNWQGDKGLVWDLEGQIN